MKFTKMQGCGNDYVYVNAFEEKIEDPSELAKKISDRHFGIGSDGLILVCPSDKCDVKMKMYNADGSESEMCGNGVRCVAKFACDHILGAKKEVTVETLAGIKKITMGEISGLTQFATVDMGEPVVSCEKIPVLIDKEKAISEKVLIGGREYRITCVSMGNPHAVTYVDDVTFPDFEKIGQQFENDRLFPNRVNAEFVKVVNRNEIEMRVWERGSGETFACGTGACASAYASMLNGYTENKVAVKLKGGTLLIEYKDGHIFMTGPATTVFEGETDTSLLEFNSTNF